MGFSPLKFIFNVLCHLINSHLTWLCLAILSHGLGQRWKTATPSLPSKSKTLTSHDKLGQDFLHRESPICNTVFIIVIVIVIINRTYHDRQSPRGRGADQFLLYVSILGKRKKRKGELLSNLHAYGYINRYISVLQSFRSQWSPLESWCYFWRTVSVILTWSCLFILVLNSVSNCTFFSFSFFIFAYILRTRW